MTLWVHKRDLLVEALQVLGTSPPFQCEFFFPDAVPPVVMVKTLAAYGIARYCLIPLRAVPSLAAGIEPDVA